MKTSNPGKLKKALLIVDMQNDFCPSGALPVAEGDLIVPVLNKYIQFFAKNQLPIFASRDWHPSISRHFKRFGGNWPRHCVSGTRGAKFHKGLKLPKEAVVLSKGMDPEEDSYSAFQAIDSKGILFANILQTLGVKKLFIGGLATDYCVKHSVRDALKNGFKVKLLMDAIKGVNIQPQDSEEAIAEMFGSGAKKINLSYLSKK